MFGKTKQTCLVAFCCQAPSVMYLTLFLCNAADNVFEHIVSYMTSGRLTAKHIALGDPKRVPCIRNVLECVPIINTGDPKKGYLYVA